ncbi:MAG: hypothetical protein KBA06_02985, partial [Saprospiraceae bacterium]|nr:hypothetical protein [Saprospiraceae bacterium]
LRENTIVIQSHKYMNNYDYNRAIYIINNIANLDFGSIILLNNSEFSTRIATLHYEFYDIIENAISDCTHNGDKIQCVVASDKVNFVEKVKFGETQLPTLWNYADGIDTLEFLVENA